MAQVARNLTDCIPATCRRAVKLYASRGGVPPSTTSPRWKSWVVVTPHAYNPVRRFLGVTMSRDEVAAFLNRVDPPLLGVVGTIDSAGHPSAVPVWYRYDGEVVNICTHTNRAWPKHVQREPRVSFSVLEPVVPFAAVLIKGRAEIIVEGRDHWAEVRRITERYIAPEKVDAYIEPWSMLDAMCVIHPEKLVSWKQRY